MPRYIDAETLMQKLCNQCGVKDREYFCHAHCGDRMNIENIPTADVQPVKHGEWVEKRIIHMKWIPNDDDSVNTDDVEPERMTEQKCSYCNRWTIKFTDHIELDYCPLCGARMDGDKSKSDRDTQSTI